MKYVHEERMSKPTEMSSDEQGHALDMNALLHLAALSNSQDGNSIVNTANNVSKTDGWVVGLAIASFGLMLLNAIFCAIWISNLWAWKDIQTRDITDIQHDVKHLQESAK
jgi:hypothetical protein